MDDDGSLNLNNWGYYQQPMKGSLGLQLMPNLTSDHHDPKPLFSNSPYFQNHPPPHYTHYHIHQHHYSRDPDLPEPSFNSWIRQNRDTTTNNGSTSAPKVHHLPLHTNYNLIPTAIQMIQPPPPPLKEELIDSSLPLDDDNVIKKRPQVHAPIKPPKQKKPKKNDLDKGKCEKKTKSTDVVINGIDLDLSRIPPPVCSCTGNPQQCYRWGVGGWQSACCTTSVSMYPLPMSQKRKGARIAGRKMSQGAFKKVLEKLAGEGYNLANPIDLRGFWPKRGTCKFVTFSHLGAVMIAVTFIIS